MNRIVLEAAAKLNLSLDIVGRREDGYHLLDMVMQSVSLFDRVTLEKSAGIFLTSDCSYLPTDRKNTAYRAAECFFEETGIIGGALIDVQKKIPSQAGMAGGSADAAAVLAGLNALYQVGLSVNELQKIGLRVGADVPYCLVGGTARVQGVGEVLIPIKPLTDGIFVIVKPKVGISTVKAYEKFDALLASAHPDNDKLVEAVKRGQISDFQKFMYNVLEQTVELSVVNRIEESLLRSGASAAMMTGSGSAVFGVFHSRILASKAYDRLSQNHSSFLAEPIHFGVRVVREE